MQPNGARWISDARLKRVFDISARLYDQAPLLPCPLAPAQASDMSIERLRLIGERNVPRTVAADDGALGAQAGRAPVMFVAAMLAGLARRHTYTTR